MIAEFLSRLAGREVTAESLADCWQQTPTGKRVNALTLRPEDVSSVDIAYALAGKNKFNSWAWPPYSVAQHSVLVAQNCESKLEGLLHEARKAYCFDVPGPIKQALRVAGITIVDEIEDHVHRVICEKFKIPVEEPEDVREADLKLGAAEGEAFFGDTPAHLDWKIRKATSPCLWPACIVPWTPEQSRVQFLRAFDLLTRHRRNMEPSKEWSVGLVSKFETLKKE